MEINNRKQQNQAIQEGCLDLWIDDLVSCLKDTETGKLLDTVVFKIESRSYLKKFQKTNG